MMAALDGAWVLADGEGDRYAPPGHPEVVVKAASEQTGGAYSLLEFTVDVDGPPLHVHHETEEAFYILEGEVEITVGPTTVRAVAGGFVLIPRETPHTFKNGGSKPARILTIFSPAGFEQFFIQVAAVEDSPETPGFRAAVQRIRQSLGGDVVDAGT